MKKNIITILLVLCSALLLAQWHIDEGFEESTDLPAGWTTHDDGDGSIWRVSTSNAHSGSHAAFVDNYLPNQNQDWLVTPQISVNAGDYLEFYTRSWYGTEALKVYVSTSGNNVSNFNTMLLHMEGLNSTYEMGTVSLDSYADQNIYLGFYWECDTYGILLDDVKVGQVPTIDPELDLPDTANFYQGDVLQIDFTEYIVVTDLSSASLSVSGNTNITVEIDGLIVSFSAPDFVGTEELTFTLLDTQSDQTASDQISVSSMAHPTADLYIAQVIYPRYHEFVGLPFNPEIMVGNAGTTVFSGSIEIVLNVSNQIEESLHIDTAIIDAEILPDQSVAVSFPQSFTPEQTGELNYSFHILTQDDNPDNNSFTYVSEVVIRESSGGPDSFGYRYIDSNEPLGPEYDWIEISETGTSTIMYGVDAFHGDDNFSEPIPLSFDFPFYGSNYSSAYVDINGEILLADNSWYTNFPSSGWGGDGNMFNYMYPIPGYTQMPGLIAVYWDDLQADEGTGDVYFQSFGTAPERYTVFQWDSLRFRAGTGAQQLLKFQVILHENGDLKMQYHTVATGQTGANVPHDLGRSSTIAIQNAAADAGLCYLREIVQGSSYIGVEPAGNLLHDGLAILFYGGEDTQAPIITHKAAGNTFAQDILLTARIMDMSEIAQATMYYDPGTGWQSMEYTELEQNDYNFVVADLPLGSSFKYYFEAIDAEGNLSKLPETAPSEYYSFQILPTADTQVLIAYSGIQDYRRLELPIYEAAMQELNLGYDIYNWEEYDEYAIDPQYEAVLTYANTGSVNDKMKYFAGVLTDYLDLGTVQSPKNLWFSSDGLASSQHGQNNASPVRRLMSGYFRTHYIATGFGGGTNGLGGPDNFSYEHGTIKALPGTPVGTSGLEYPVYANSPDCIFPDDAAGSPYYDEVPYPEIGANYVYAFEDGPINGQAYLYHGVAATTVDTPSYRTMYFSFDFSQLTNSAHQQEWMNDLMSWWNITPTANSDAFAPVISSGLDSIYPNPFNPSTSVRYNIARAEKVSLNIYNLRGQKVKSLINESKTAGAHTVSWDGTDEAGNPVASGVYYLRLQTDTARETRKLTMIK